MTRGPRLKLIGIAAGVATTCGFGYLAVRNVDFGIFRDGLAHCNYTWLAPAVILLALTVALRSVRWGLLFPPEGRPPLGALTRSLLIGYFFNQILPARAGEAARVLALHRESGTSRAQAAGTAVVERIYDVLSLLMLLFTAAPFLPHVTWLRRAALFALVFAVLLVVFVVALLRYRERPPLAPLRPLRRIPGVSSEHVNQALANLIQGLGALHRPRLAVPAFLVTVASWLVLALSFLCVLTAFHLGVGFGAGLLAVIATNLALVIPSAPAAVGVFEAAMLVALSPYGIGDSRALAAAVVLHALNLFPFLVAGMWALNRHVLRVRRRDSGVATGAESHAGSRMR